MASRAAGAGKKGANALSSSSSGGGIIAGGSGGGAHAKIKKKARGEAPPTQFYSSGQTVRVGATAGNSGASSSVGISVVDSGRASVSVAAATATASDANNNNRDSAAAAKSITDAPPPVRVGSRRVSTARDPSVLVQVPVEYWDPRTGRWSEGAELRAKKDAAFVELPQPLQGEKIIKFDLDSSLRVEHSTPLARDFNLVITGSGGRQRVAVYGEGEGLDVVRVLRGQGAQIVRRKTLPPCAPPPSRPLPPPPVPTAAKPKKGGLRPISEGEILATVRREEEEGEDESNMIIGSRRGGGGGPLVRRKSTGSSDPDLSRVKKQIAASASGDSDLPRSSSTGIKDGWYSRRLEGGRGGEAAEEGRGLSTGNTARMGSNSGGGVGSSRRKQRSDQSLNSDEVSSGSFQQDDDFDYHRRRLLLRGSDSSLATASSEDDPDGVFGLGGGRRGSSGTSSQRSSEPRELAPQLQHQPPDLRRVAGVEDEKLERYKFLLVNIEEDPNLLDPGELGAGDGGYAGCGFDDYPDDLMEGEDETDRRREQLQEQMPKWIRKSFEELDLDISGTEHERRKSSSSAFSAAAAAKSRSMPRGSPSPTAAAPKRHSRLRQAASVDLGDGYLRSVSVNSSLSEEAFQQGLDSPSTPPPSSRPPPPLRQASRTSSKKVHHSHKRPHREKKRPVMLFDDGEGEGGEGGGGTSRRRTGEEV